MWAMFAAVATTRISHPCRRFGTFVLSPVSLDAADRWTALRILIHNGKKVKLEECLSSPLSVTGAAVVQHSHKVIKAAIS